jgi:methyl-accepting chemotaxis protein
MLEAARAANRLMDGIAHDSQEQASAVDAVTTAIRDMDAMTQQNASLVEEINAAIEQTDGQASDLDRAVDGFKLAAEKQGSTQARRSRRAA